MFRTFFCLVAAVSIAPVLAGNASAGNDLDTEIGIDLAYDIHLTDAEPESEQTEIVARGEFSRTRITVKSNLHKWLQTKVAMELKKDGKPPELKDAIAELYVSRHTDAIVGRQKVLGGMDQSLSKMEQFLLDRSLANNLFGLDRFNTLELAWESKSGRGDDQTHTRMLGRAMVFQDSKPSAASLEGTAVKLTLSSSNRHNAMQGLVGVNGHVTRTQQRTAEYELETPIFTAEVNGYKFNRPKNDWHGFETLAIDAGVRINRWIVQAEHFHRRDENIDGRWYQSSGHYWLISRSFGGVHRELATDAFEPDIGGPGGWELTLRCSRAQLSAPDFIGDASTLTAGINVYLGSNSKFAIQYQSGRTEEQDGGEIDSKDATGALSVRLQYTY